MGNTLFIGDSYNLRELQKGKNQSQQCTKLYKLLKVLSNRTKYKSKSKVREVDTLIKISNCNRFKEKIEVDNFRINNTKDLEKAKEELER